MWSNRKLAHCAFRPQSVKQLKQRASMKLATIVQGTSPPIPEDDASLNVSHRHSFTARPSATLAISTAVTPMVHQVYACEI